MPHKFKVIIEQDENGVYIPVCPELKGCHSQGDTIEEAIEHIKEAIELCLEDDQAFGEPIPEGSLDGEIEIDVEIKSSKITGSR